MLCLICIYFWYFLNFLKKINWRLRRPRSAKRVVDNVSKQHAAAPTPPISHDTNQVRTGQADRQHQRDDHAERQLDKHQSDNQLALDVLVSVLLVDLVVQLDHVQSVHAGSEWREWRWRELIAQQDHHAYEQWSDRAASDHLRAGQLHVEHAEKCVQLVDRRAVSRE